MLVPLITFICMGECQLCTPSLAPVVLSHILHSRIYSMLDCSCLLDVFVQCMTYPFTRSCMLCWYDSRLYAGKAREKACLQTLTVLHVPGDPLQKDDLDTKLDMHRSPPATTQSASHAMQSLVRQADKTSLHTGKQTGKQLLGSICPEHNCAHECKPSISHLRRLLATAHKTACMHARLMAPVSCRYKCVIVLCDSQWCDPDLDSSNGIQMGLRDMLRIDSMLMMVQLNIRVLLEVGAPTPATRAP